MNQPFDDSAKTFYQRFFTDLGMRTTTQYIEGSTNSQQLRQWLEEALDAPDLAQINFVPNPET